MSTAYEDDVIAWAREQASLPRPGRLSAIDIEHIADEVEHVGKSEQRDLASRTAVLPAHLLKWRFQPAFQSLGWRRTIRDQRNAIARGLARTPSPRRDLEDGEWLQDIWSDAVAKAVEETGLADFPDACPWSPDQIMDMDFLPG